MTVWKLHDEVTEPTSDHLSRTTYKFDQGGDEGHTLFGTRFQPSEGPIRCLIVVNHGFGEYISPTYTRYVMPQLASQLEAVVFGHDLVGHGRSSGPQCQTQQDYVLDYVEPALAHARHMMSRHPDVPLFVLGHSMGGLISLLAAIQEPSLFRGVLLMAPLIEVDPSMATPCNLFMAKWLAHLLPGLQISGIKADTITRNQSELDQLLADPMYYTGGVKVKHAFYGLQALEQLERAMAGFQVPTLIQQGTHDQIVRPEGAHKLFRTISAPDKQLLEYPEAFHSMYIELEDVVESVVRDEIEWIQKRLH